MVLGSVKYPEASAEMAEAVLLVNCSNVVQLFTGFHVSSFDWGAFKGNLQIKRERKKMLSWGKMEKRTLIY